MCLFWLLAIINFSAFFFCCFSSHAPSPLPQTNTTHQQKSKKNKKKISGKNNIFFRAKRLEHPLQPNICILYSILYYVYNRRTNVFFFWGGAQSWMFINIWNKDTLCTSTGNTHARVY
jgi:hypothetical protein